MYQALYRKYRPQTFDDVAGQQAVTRTLKAQLLSGKLSHAYLFTGSRGTGKTSCAKILAKAVNCLAPEDGNPCNRCAACRSIDEGSCMDVLEIDAASNNGVDNVRDLRDDAVYTPSQVKTRVYIIDEVHMLSISAFNALLKIIEEPPEHLLFILATTELHKVPATILSRCQRFAFRRPGAEEIGERIEYVACQEGVTIEPEAVRILARLADGAFRDGLNLLDQCISGVERSVTAERVYQCLGIAGQKQTAAMMEAIAKRDTAAALALFNRLYAEGKDIAAMLDELCALSRDLLILKTAPKAGIAMLSGVCSESEAMGLLEQLSPPELIRIAGIVQQTLAGFTRSASRRVDAELCLVNLCEPSMQMDAQSLNARLTRLEEKIASGQFVTQAVKQDLEEEAPPPWDDEDAPPAPVEEPAPAAQGVNQTPVGFWTELVARIRAELRPPLSGFFAASPNAPVQGEIQGSTLVLLCANGFTLDMVNKPELLAMIGQKAQAILGSTVAVKAVDRQAGPAKNNNMEQLLAFGKAHNDIIKIK